MASDLDKRKSISKALKARQTGSVKATLQPPLAQTETPLIAPPEMSAPPIAPATAPAPIVTKTNKKIEIQNQSIDSFHSLEALNKHLSRCYQAREDFHLISRAPEKDIVQFIFSHVENQDDLSTFKTAFNILTLTSKINVLHNRTFTNYENEALKLLSVYGNKISELLKIGSTTALNKIELFYADFNKNKQISELRKLPTGSFTLFSVANRLHDIIEAIDNKYKRLQKGKELQSRQSSQKDYAQLLDVMLEGGAPENIIPLLRPTVDEEQSESTLLPATEFDVPSAEPEHPDRIGINKTMSFIPAKDRPTILDAFSTKELIQDFLNSFKEWAADVNSLHRLGQAKNSKITNLLGTEHTFSPIIQMAVMRYVLLSLDALGKVCGNNGDLAIQNYPVVKDITDRLQILSERLTEMSFEEDPHFIEELKVMTFYLAARNQAFYNMQKQYDPPLEVRSNSELNGFCHINERLAAKILNIVFKRSVLTPDMPSASLTRKLQHAESHTGHSAKKTKPRPTA